MNLSQALLNRLKDEQQRYALEALMKPTEKSSFEYGQRSGMVLGLEEAVRILLDIIDNHEKHGANL